MTAFPRLLVDKALPTPRDVQPVASNKNKTLATCEMRAYNGDYGLLTGLKASLQNAQYTYTLYAVVRDETKPLIVKQIRKELENAGWNVVKVEWGENEQKNSITVEVSPVEGVKSVDCLVKEMFDELGKKAEKGKKEGGVFARLKRMRSTLWF